MIRAVIASGLRFLWIVATLVNGPTDALRNGNPLTLSGGLLPVDTSPGVLNIWSFWHDDTELKAFEELGSVSFKLAADGLAAKTWRRLGRRRRARRRRVLSVLERVAGGKAAPAGVRVKPGRPRGPTELHEEGLMKKVQ